MNRIQKRTLREIDRRVEAPREISGSETRAVMREMCRPMSEGVKMAWRQACGVEPNGFDGMGRMKLDDLEGLIYADAWCKAYGRPIDDYLDMFGTKGCRAL